MSTGEHRQSQRAALRYFDPSCDYWWCNHVPDGISLKTRARRRKCGDRFLEGLRILRVERGAYRMVFFVMLSCLIFKCNVDGGIPSLAAAPFFPATLP